MPLRTCLSTGDFIAASTSTISATALVNCSVAVVGGSLNALKSRRLTEKLVLRVTKSGSSGAVPVFVLEATVPSAPGSVNKMAQGLFAVKIETPVTTNTAEGLLKFDIAGVLQILDCTVSTHVLAFNTTNPAFGFGVVISLPPVGTGPAVYDISIGRYWLALSAQIGATFGADPVISFDSNQKFSESRNYQVYSGSTSPAAVRKRLRVTLPRITAVEYSDYLHMGVEQFLKRSLGSEVVIARGEQYGITSLYRANTEQPEPMQLKKGRIDSASVRPFAGMYSADLDFLEEN